MGWGYLTITESELESIVLWGDDRSSHAIRKALLLIVPGRCTVGLPWVVGEDNWGAVPPSPDSWPPFDALEGGMG